MAEKVLLHYEHEKTYTITENNAIGATKSTTLRTVQAHNDTNCKYVKKFGTDYAIGDVANGVIATPRSDGGGVNKWWFEFYNENDTLLGTVKDESGTSTFVDGTAEASTRIYIKLVWKAGTVAITNGDTLNLTTDVDAPLAVKLSGEGIISGELLWALSASGSTYYMEDSTDNAMMYGGYRHTTTGTVKYPYFDIQTAENILHHIFNTVTVLDNEIYDEEIEIINTGYCTYIQVVLGKIATITSGIGARVTREVSTQYNNTTAIYFNENGNNADDGTWQTPKLTIGNAITNRGGKHVVYGGTGATVEGGIFNENIIIDGAFTLESDYGYIPVINNNSADIITITHVNGNIKGLNINGLNSNNNNIVINVGNWNGIIENCNSYNNNNGINYYMDNGITGIIKKNILYGNIDYGIDIYALGNRTIGTEIKNCICYNNDYGIRIRTIDFGTFSGTINDCICYNNVMDGLQMILGESLHGGFFTGVINNNNFIKNDRYGISVYNFDSFSGTINDCICYNNVMNDLYAETCVTITITESNYETNDGFAIGAGCITTDPKFCKTDDLPYKFGLSADSGAYRTGTPVTCDDMGARFRIVEYKRYNITVNGFIIDGQNQYNNGIYKLGTQGYSYNTLQWCTIINFQGISIDYYVNFYNSLVWYFRVLNCIIKHNGNGIKFVHSGNHMQECLIYNNTIFGVWSGYVNNIFSHNVFYNNYYGLYLSNNSNGITYKNNISHQNSLYGIYSEVSLIVIYSCITDAVNSNVDTTDISNITDNPLFIDVTSGAEDFRIKVKELGYTFDSPCKSAGDDNKDIGAYDVTYAIKDEYWRKYQLEYNPANLNLDVIAKGERRSSDGLGSISLWTKSHKRQLPMSWDSGNYTSEKQRKILEYMSTLIPSRENNLTKDGSLFRITLLPVSYLNTGTGATVDSTAKTITKADMNLVSNEFKGFWIGVKYDTGTGAVISASGKTLTDAGASWVINEWTGYFIYYAQNYYYIKSNTATVLTLSDVLGTLTDKTGYAYGIEKYFKIVSNTKTVFTVEDTDDELISGSYDWYINFIVCKLQRSRFGYKQPGYNYKYEHMKTGYKIAFEEE